MTVFGRVISGSVASGAKLGTVLLTQVAMVPVLLQRWPVEEFSCWLIVQAIAALSCVVSVAHHNLVGFQLLAVGSDRERASAIICSSVPLALAIAVIEFLLLLSFCRSGGMSYLIGDVGSGGQALTSATSDAVILQAATWVLASSVGGLGGRLLVSLGLFARATWWSVATLLLSSCAAALVAFFGGNLLDATAGSAVVILAIGLAFHRDVWTSFKSAGLTWQKPKLSSAFANVLPAFSLASVAILDFAKQQGLRLLLTTFTGVRELAVFSTLRTLSNVAAQGMAIVTSPIQPEAMRYFHSRRSDYLAAAMGAIWAIAVCLVMPMLVFAQVAMPSIFEVWTRDKIVFDPWVFCFLSVALTVFSIAQPQVTVLQGSNNSRALLAISFASVVVLLFGVAVTVPSYGARGAALALASSELVGFFISTRLVVSATLQQGIGWPRKLARAAGVSALGATLSMMTIASESAFKFPLLVCSFTIYGCGAVLLYCRLPVELVTVLRARIHALSGKSEARQ